MSAFDPKRTLPSTDPTTSKLPMPVIGFLNGQSAATFKYLVATFQNGLSENGFVENQNVTIEYRRADEHVERLRTPK